MSIPLLSEEIAPKVYDLLALAIKAQDEPHFIPILGDAIITMGWHHPWVMPMCLKMDLDPRRPHFVNRSQREAWEDMFDRGIESANNALDAYQGKRPDWARAVLAALLFDGWDKPKRRTSKGAIGTRSPWALIRVHVPSEEFRRRQWARDVYNVEIDDDGIGEMAQP